MIKIKDTVSLQLIEAEDESEIELDGTTVLKNLTCKTLDSQSIHLSWSAPPLGRNGAKLGYIVTYGTSDSWFGNIIYILS